eukprot:1137343-Pelagomonas_calceolata.AAC.3
MPMCLQAHDFCAKVPVRARLLWFYTCSRSVWKRVKEAPTRKSISWRASTAADSLALGTPIWMWKHLGGIHAMRQPPSFNPRRIWDTQHGAGCCVVDIAGTCRWSRWTLPALVLIFPSPQGEKEVEAGVKLCSNNTSIEKEAATLESRL